MEKSYLFLVSYIQQVWSYIKIPCNNFGIFFFIFAAIQGGNKRQFERLNLSKIFEKVSLSVQVMDNYACRL